MVSLLPTIKVLLKASPKNPNDEDLWLPYTTEPAAETSPTFPPYVHSFMCLCLFRFTWCS